MATSNICTAIFATQKVLNYTILSQFSTNLLTQ